MGQEEELFIHGGGQLRLIFLPSTDEESCPALRLLGASAYLGELFCRMILHFVRLRVASHLGQ